MKRALIVGCGYTGERLARRLLDTGAVVLGTTRDAERGAELRRAGIEPSIGELDARETLGQIEKFEPELVAYFVPPRDDGTDPLLTKVLTATRLPLEAFLYASSTSIYGNRDGAWVDETTAIRPEDAPGSRHSCERLMIEAARDRGMPTRVCRITGIYGPGRTLRRSLESGRYVLIDGHDTWVSRIHVDDLVTGLIAAWQHGEAGGLYNIVDDEPHRASEFARLAARLHGLAEPAVISEAEARERLSESRFRRKLTNKRVRSIRLKQELGVDLEYPTYRVGLPAAVEAERGRS
ncbi:MAG: NAD-dependent epimerase/dehydratase family protein [Gemmatimonadetes bacterium]|nr:NAD-dependent epimerase/dehydratase family protein [Gemmatimonadota bacterium]